MSEEVPGPGRYSRNCGSRFGSLISGAFYIDISKLDSKTRRKLSVLLKRKEKGRIHLEMDRRD